MAKAADKASKPRAGAPTASGASAADAAPSSLPVMLRWFLSKRIRHATAMRKHVQKILNHQRDILAPQAIEAVESAMSSCQKAVAEGADNAAIEGQMDNLEKVANKWIKPYPNAAWRENIEVLLVALAVAMGIRTFSLQPFKIPTGSMQPTLFGVTSSNLLGDPEGKIPTGLTRVRQWFGGVSYLHKVASNDGALERVGQPVRLLIFNLWQTFVVGGKTYILWFPPDYGTETLESRAGLQFGQTFHKGEDILKLRVNAGDHLFVDRLTYNFRPPERGEITVFETRGIPEEGRLRFGIAGDQFYIKRLVGLGGETLSIEQQYEVDGIPKAPGTVPVGQLAIDGQILPASTPHFENLYSFSDASRSAKVLQYKQNHYYGHAMIGLLAPGQKYHLENGDYFVMGDNTMNSLDSRYWSGFPKQSVIGKSAFVYWPITERFGWGNR